MKNKLDRRKVLAGIATGSALALAGCSLPENGEETETETPDFSYPEGFSETGIENFEQALGVDSAHYNASSFSFDSEYEFDRPNSTETQSITARSKVSAEQESQYYYTENPSTVQEQYNTGSVVFLRLYSKQREQEQFQRQDSEFNKEGAYLLSLFQDQIQGIDLSVDEVGDSTVSYVASLDDVPEDHFLREQYNNNLVSLDLTLTVDVDGFPEKIVVDITRSQDTPAGNGGDTAESTEESTTESGDQPTIDQSYSFNFSNYGTTTVEEPSWLPDAREATQQTATATPAPPTDSTEESSSGSTATQTDTS